MKNEVDKQSRTTVEQQQTKGTYNNDKKPTTGTRAKKEHDSFRQRVHSFRTFINYFYVEQNENPFHALVGPGPGHPKTFSLSHLWYVFILFFIPVCSLLSTLGFVQPYLASDNSLCDWKKQPKSCQSVIVVFITYRIGFSSTIFFLFTALILSKSSSRSSTPDGLSTLHTGFWIEKVIIVLVISCVSFAFPPVVFDTIWIYGVLLGDILMTGIMLFLLCDFVQYLHCKMLDYIDSRKFVYLNRKVIICMEYTIAMLIQMGFLLGSVYTISTSRDNQWMVAYITLLTIYLNGQLLHVILHQKSELLYTFYITGYVFLLTWVTIENHKQYKDNDRQWQPIWSPTNVITLVLVYTVTIYSIVRKSESYQFYYFFWEIYRGDTDHNYSGNDEMDQNNENDNEKQRANGTRNEYRNLNETLLDQSIDAKLAPTSRETQQQQQQQQQQQATAINFRDGTTYNESFIHLFFAILSMKTTAAVTNYNILVYDKYEYDYLATMKALSSILALYLSTILVIVIFTGYLYRVYVDKGGNQYSVGLILKSIVQNLGNATSAVLFDVPKCLRDSSLCRFVYSLFFTIIFILACFTISPAFRKYFERLSFFCEHVTVFGACMSRDPAFVSLYRIFGTVGIFYSIVSWLTIDMFFMSKVREKFHKGCWPIKLLLLIVIFACIVNLPSTNSRYWLYFSLVSILVFTLLQLLCLIDAVSKVTELFGVNKGTAKFPAKKIAVGSASLTLLLYAISLTAYVCFYVFYAHNYRCAVTRLFVSVNLVLCITASIISIHPIINNSGLLLSAMVTSFCMYNTWSALNYNPTEVCNPLAHTLLLVESRPSRDAVSTMDLILMFVTLIYFNVRIKDITRRIFDATFLSSIYSLLKRNKGNNNKTNFSQTASEPPLILLGGIEKEKAHIEKWLADCKETALTSSFITRENPREQQTSLNSQSSYNDFDTAPEEKLNTMNYTIQNTSNNTTQAIHNPTEQTEQNFTQHTTQNTSYDTTQNTTYNLTKQMTQNTPYNTTQTTYNPTQNDARQHTSVDTTQNTTDYRTQQSDTGTVPNKVETKGDTIETFDTAQHSQINTDNNHSNELLSEDDDNKYSYSCLHFICYMACSYSFLLLAHWLEPVPGSGFKISLHWAIMSVKLVSSTLSVLVYIWYMMIPVITNKLSNIQ